MSESSELTNAAFVEFLTKLGVDTCNLSFEWILEDPKFSAVLRWMYDNLGSDNVLTPYEQARYEELEKSGQLLDADTLEKEIEEIKVKYAGICLPGDEDGLQMVKMNIEFNEERINMLQEQNAGLEDMIKQTTVNLEALNKDIEKLEASKKQCEENVACLGRECLQCAEDIESLNSQICTVVGEKLEDIANAPIDKEATKKFLTFCPFHKYELSRASFRTHFNLFSANTLNSPAKSMKEEELNMILVKAQAVEKRLLYAIEAYAESTATLKGLKASSEFLENYSVSKSGNNTVQITELSNTVSILEQEEAVLKSQIAAEAARAAAARTAALDGWAAALHQRIQQQVLRDLEWVRELVVGHLCLERVLYTALRRELAALEDALHTAAGHRIRYSEARSAVPLRIEAMNEIMNEQEQVEVGSCDSLVRAILDMAVCEGNRYEESLQAFHKALLQRYNTSQQLVVKAARLKQQELDNWKASHTSLYQYINKASGLNSTYLLTAPLAKAITQVSERMKEEASQQSAANKHNMDIQRKLWQWFVADHNALDNVLKSKEDIGFQAANTGEPTFSGNT